MNSSKDIKYFNLKRQIQQKDNDASSFFYKQFWTAVKVNLRNNLKQVMTSVIKRI